MCWGLSCVTGSKVIKMTTWRYWHMTGMEALEKLLELVKLWISWLATDGLSSERREFGWNWIKFIHFLAHTLNLGWSRNNRDWRSSSFFPPLVLTKDCNPTPAIVGINNSSPINWGLSSPPPLCLTDNQLRFPANDSQFLGAEKLISDFRRKYFRFAAW